jgi:tRNA(Ile2) C34 agmatinyltransferase TiaS
MTMYYFLKMSGMPRCITCKKEMDYWTFGQKEYEHPECSAERISNKMISKVKRDLSNKF